MIPDLAAWAAPPVSLHPLIAESGAKWFLSLFANLKGEGVGRILGRRGGGEWILGGGGVLGWGGGPTPKQAYSNDNRGT